MNYILVLNRPALQCSFSMFSYIFLFQNTQVKENKPGFYSVYIITYITVSLLMREKMALLGIQIVFYMFLILEHINI